MADDQHARVRVQPGAPTDLSEAAAPGWGEPISEARQQELTTLLAAWDAPGAEHGTRSSPFEGEPGTLGMQLSGADVYWLAERVRDTAHGFVHNLHLEGANLLGAKLAGANLSGAHLAGAVLAYTLLYEADLFAADLRGANLLRANLTGADFGRVHFDGKTSLSQALLIQPEDTRPLRARLLRQPRYAPALGDIHWGDLDLVELTQLNGWDHVRRLADERELSRNRDPDAYRGVIRAYRQVAQRLRDQGVSEAADRLAERAQVIQRKLSFRELLLDWRRPWRLPGHLLRWVFSWFLALLAGYGYHPGRSVFWYLATILGFAYAYHQVTHGLPVGPLFHGAPASDIQALHPNEALILSVSAFHGRGFFQPIKSLGDPVAALAAIEAVIGLLIEISFIATFTQRFFGAR